MPNKKSNLILVVLFVAGALVLGYGFKKWAGSRNHNIPLEENGQVPSLQQLLEQDKKNISNPEATEKETFQALLRLARSGDESVKPEIQKRMTDGNSTIRSAAAEASGYFGDATALPLIATALNDKEKIVRIGAIRGLSHKSTPERIKALQDYLRVSKLDTDEKLTVYTSLAQIGDPVLKSEMVGHILDIAKPTENPSVENEAVATALLMGGKDERVTHLMREKLRSSDNPPVLAMAIQHLVVADPSWARSEYPKYFSHEKPEVRAAAIQVLHLACPEDLWEMLANAIGKDSSPVVVNSAVQETQLISGPEAKELLEKVEQGGRVKDPAGIEALKQAQAAVTAHPNPNFCASQSEPAPAHPTAQTPAPAAQTKAPTATSSQPAPKKKPTPTVKKYKKAK